MNNKAIIYCRVATQDEETRSKLAWQEQICRDYAKSKGYEVIETLSEVGSGMTPDRPKLLELTEMVKTNKAKHIVVSSPDRVSRNEVNLILFKNLLRRQKTLLEYAQLNNSGANSMFLEGILGSIEAYYSKVHSQRVKRGIAKAKRRKTTFGSTFTGKLNKILLKLTK